MPGYYLASNVMQYPPLHGTADTYGVQCDVALLVCCAVWLAAQTDPVLMF